MQKKLGHSPFQAPSGVQYNQNCDCTKPPEDPRAGHAMRTLIAITLFLPFLISAASFDCTKAEKHNEKLICNSHTLNLLDEELSSKYKIAIQNGDETLRADQINWIRLTNKICKTEDCLSDSYTQRIKTLETWHKKVPADKTMLGNFDVMHPVFIFNNEKKEGFEKIYAHDCLSISKIDDNTIKFSINSIGANAHLCSISGTATLKNGIYFYNKGSDTSDDDSACNLTISNRKTSVLINDPNNGCKYFSCGMRAGLDGLTFSKNLITEKQCRVEY